MGPVAPKVPTMFVVGEKMLCYHKEMLYEAKIVKVGLEEKPKLFVHYTGWNNKWDEWVEEDKVLKFTPENLKLMAETKKAAQAYTSSKSFVMQEQQIENILFPAFLSKSVSFAHHVTQTVEVPYGFLHWFFITPMDYSALQVSKHGPQVPLLQDRHSWKKPARKSSAKANTSLDRSGSAGRNASRTSTPTPVHTPTLSAISGYDSSRSDASIVMSVPRPMATPKQARRSARKSAIMEAPRSEGGKTRSSSGVTSTRASRSRAESVSASLKRRMPSPSVPITKRQLQLAKLKTSKEPPYPFDFDRIKDYVDMADFPVAAYPFHVPDEIRKLFLYDRWMSSEEELVPLVPAKDSLRKMLSDYAHQRKLDKKHCREDDLFVSGCMSVFNNIVRCVVTKNEAVVHPPVGDKCDVYGLIHFIRFLSVFPKLHKKIWNFATPDNMRDRMHLFLEYLADNQDDYFAENCPLFTVPAALKEE